MTKITSNQPLTHRTVSELEVKTTTKTDPKGREKRIHMLSYENPFPNRFQRRLDKRRMAHHNAKDKPGVRKVQFAPVMRKEKTKYGVVNIPTGYVRKIVHLITYNKVMNSTQINKG